MLVISTFHQRKYFTEYAEKTDVMFRQVMHISFCRPNARINAAGSIAEQPPILRMTSELNPLALNELLDAAHDKITLNYQQSAFR
jgi:hypothetical protein